MGLALGGINLLLLLFTRFVLAGSLLYPLLHLSGEAREIADFMLLVLAAVAPLRSVNTINIVGVLRGGGDVKTAMLFDVLPMFLLALPASAASALLFGGSIVPMYLLKNCDEIRNSSSPCGVSPPENGSVTSQRAHKQGGNDV